jgi:hypothetical protein
MLEFFFMENVEIVIFWLLFFKFFAQDAFIFFTVFFWFVVMYHFIGKLFLTFTC